MFKTTRAVARLSTFALAAFSAFSASATDVPRAVWQEAPSSALSADMPQPGHRRTLTLDFHQASALIARTQRAGAAVALSLPHPDGGFHDFLLSDSGVMPAELKAKYPEIVSLSGIDGEGRSARVDVSPMGLHAMVFDADGVWIVRPERRDGAGDRYMSYERAELAVPGEKFQCGTHGDAIQASGLNLGGDRPTPTAPLVSTGANTRNYRAAVAANHNYVAAVCPGNLTVACGLGQVVLAMNRVNQVYETELGVHMTLIADNDKIIYPLASGNPPPTTPTNDPYGNSTNALGQNQTNLTNVIGSANYDIGHVFTTGSGGVAGLGVTCRDTQKARGTTGLSNPVGDDFYIDYVSHEMGHQFGGNHTFNSTTSSCGGGNREAGAAYEPGSGSSIQAYAGICGVDNLQPHSDPYFHAKSLDEINTWIGGIGGNCVAATPSTHAAPVIDPASLPAGLTIPKQTPFALSAVATDADGDLITYNWEQYDLGSATTLAQGDTGNGPIFRSYNATLSPTRTFPSLSAVLAGGALPKGEAWPNTTRNLNFRLTVRDNHDVPGTPQFGRTESANLTLAVTASAGPFVVTAPNTALTWDRADPQTVTWNVANTDVAPVSCANVRLDLSIDGGATWPFELSAGTANNGSATVTVPSGAPNTAQARVRASCVGNVFFDVSDANFSIVGVEAVPVVAVAVADVTLAVTLGSQASGTFDIGNDGGGTLTWQIVEAATAARGTGGCDNPTDIDWLSASPTSGSATSVSPSTVTVTVAPTMLEAGEHTALLCVTSNDPAHPVVEVPVNITVDLPPEIFANGFEPGN